MASRKMIKSALAGLLGTMMSRYTNFQGYWLYGFLVPEGLPITIDLMEADVPAPVDTPRSILERRSRERFRDQLRKARVPISAVAGATMELSGSGESVSGVVASSDRAGVTVHFEVRATLDSGTVYCREGSVFVAPHDAKLERRSGGYGGVAT